MEARQKDRFQYFDECSNTSMSYYRPYIRKFKPYEYKEFYEGNGMKVLEIGCGEGGNLLPFAMAGWDVVGVDLSADRIKQARSFFDFYFEYDPDAWPDPRAKDVKPGTFIAEDIFKLQGYDGQFDLILCHDVLEHIKDKEAFLINMRRFLKPDGIVFIAFPAWKMPFGGHQQLCRNKLVSHLPWIHLLPKFMYKAILKLGGESKARIDELMDIRETGIILKDFENMVRRIGGWFVTVPQFWLVNPHYKVKYGYRPRKMSWPIYLFSNAKDYVCTSAWYLIVP